MCSRAAARSVAAMRPSLLRLTAAAGATAAVLAASPPARGADAVYGGTTRNEDPIVLKADQKTQQLRSLAISWAATCSGGDARFPGSAALTAVKAVPGFRPSGDELLVARNAKGRFAGTQLDLRDLGESSA